MSQSHPTVPLHSWLLAGLMGLAGHSAGAAALTYAESFDGMGTGTTPPAGWAVHGALSGSNSSWTTSIPASGTPSAASNGTVNNTLIVINDATTGSVNSASQAYNAALTSSGSDRALATAPTSQAGVLLQLSLPNSTDLAITQISLSYDTRRFRAAGTANELPGYWVFMSLDDGATWTNLAALNPTLNGTGGTPSVPDSQGVTQVLNQIVDLTSPWAPGATLRLRWVDDNAVQTSPDQFIGLDNVALTATRFATGAVPQVTVTQPAAEAVFPAGTTSVAVAATASDSDGSVVLVTFLRNGVPFATDDTAPFEAVLGGLSAGIHAVTARATDNDGNLGVSAPVSFTINAPPSIVAGPWAGAVTPSTASISAALSASGISARAVLSLTPDLADPLYTPAVISSASQGNSVRLEAGVLAPSTRYHYALELDGILQTTGDLKGTFVTHPSPGPASFRFAFGSCGNYSNTSQYVYESIVRDEPLFFLHMGDMNYQDVNSTDPNSYRTVYTNQLTVGQLRQVARAMGMAYMWDDHDFAGNDSNRTNSGRAASRQVYRERFPHYPLPAGGPDAAIYQSFSVGRVKFILTDLRSERDPTSTTDNATKSHLGAVQKQWFKNELLAARDAETPLIIWNSSVPFVTTNLSGDDWGRFQTERRELLEFIRDNRIQNLVIVSGDMHALALDDGQATSSYVAGVRIPVLHGAALAQTGSTKGGPYTVGANTVTPNTGLGRYGLLDITDTGTSFSAVFRGRMASGSGSTWTSTSDWAYLVGQSSFTLPTEPVRPRAATGLAAHPAISGGITLTWTDNSGVETSQRIERRIDGDPTWSTLAIEPSNVTSHTDLTLAAGTQAEYRVIALNSSTEADPSAIASATAYTQLQLWKAQNLGDADAPDSGDFNGNGVVNLLEYAFDLPVASGDTSGLPTLSRGPDDRLTLRFVRERSDIIYRIRATSDLVNWDTLATDPGAVGELIEFTDPTAPNPSRYLRVEIVPVGP